MPVIIQDWIERSDLRAHPDWYYLFGDNQRRVGNGGQAKAMRGEPNAVGVRTKRTPGTDESAYWSEVDVDEFVSNVRMIAEDLKPVIDALRVGKTVVIPRDGIGTGLAGLAHRAPITLMWIGVAIETLSEVKSTDDPWEYPVPFQIDLHQFYAAAIHPV